LNQLGEKAVSSALITFVLVVLELQTQVTLIYILSLCSQSMKGGFPNNGWIG